MSGRERAAEKEERTATVAALSFARPAPRLMRRAALAAVLTAGAAAATPSHAVSYLGPQHSNHGGGGARQSQSQPRNSFRNHGNGTQPASYAHPSAPPAQTRPLITAQPPRDNNGMSPGAANPRNQYPAPPPRADRGNGQHGNGQHLGSWLRNHSGESFQDQEKSLEREPGFSRLPQGQQQHLLNRLQQLNSMPPERRQRTLNRIENMERLSPEKRQEVRGAAQQLGQLPPDRNQQVRRAFRELRDMPPEQRQSTLNSSEFRTQYSDGERNILSNLLSVEPYGGNSPQR